MPFSPQNRKNVVFGNDDLIYKGCGVKYKINKTKKIKKAILIIAVLIKDQVILPGL